MLLASNQFCISQPRAVNFVLPAAHICLNLQPRFDSSPSPTCLSSCTAKPPPSPAEFLLLQLFLPNSLSSSLAARINPRWLHLLASGSTLGPNTSHGQWGWSRGDLDVLIALLLIFKVQIARLKLHLLERPVKVMACLEQPPPKPFP